MDKKDTINIFQKLIKLPGNKDSLLEVNLEINGDKFHPELVLDISELVRSCNSSGEIDIFTCSCGEALCAGLENGIQIEHLPDAVVWRFYEPMSNKDYDDLSDEEWEAMKQKIEFRFDAEEYLLTIILAIKKIKALVLSSDEPVQLPIQNFRLDQLLALTPIVFR